MTNAPVPPSISLEGFQAGHLTLLHKWLIRPHVSRWWGEPEESLAVAANLPDGYSHALICLDQRPIGYLRWSAKNSETLVAVGLGDLPEGTVDIDLLLGEEDALGNNYGTQALSLLTQRLIADPKVPCFGLVTSVDNQSAINSYLKVGFQKDRRFNDTTFGDCWVMLYPRDQCMAGD